MISLRDRFDTIIRFLLAALVAVGCFLVVQPFLTAMMVAAVIVVVTWHPFERVRRWLGGHATSAAAVMVLGLVLLVILPLSALSGAAAAQAPGLINLAKGWLADGFTVPAWIDRIPWVGTWLHTELDAFLSNKEQLSALGKSLVEPVSRFLLAAATLLGNGLLQLVLVALVAFFFYRDGEHLAAGVKRLLERVSGALSAEVGKILIETTKSVVYGIVGTAAAQALVALVGFLIAGVPGAALLSAAVFLLSVVPVGPPLVWGGAAVWLYSQGESGWALFMFLWGALAISSVDNVVKPLLIARGTPLPIALVFLGVLGGVVAFGFIGLILGPVLLAIGVAMGREWMKVTAPRPPAHHPKGASKEASHGDAAATGAAAPPIPSHTEPPQ
jgi:predicted PurR-regulated permease PerM